MHAVHQEHALAESGDRSLHGRLVERLPTRRAFEAFHDAHLVAFGLQTSDEPRAGVREPAIIEIDRVLRGEYHAQPVRARLLEQREQQPFRRRIRDRRHVAEQFVDVQNRAERAGARLCAHPRENVGEQQRHEEHALGIAEVRDRYDRALRFSVCIVQQRRGVERLTLHPGLEAWRGKQVVELHRKLGALFGREDRVERHHADGGERRRLNAADQSGEIEIASFAPCRMQQGSEQNVLAAGDRIAVDAEQREHAGGSSLHALLHRFGVIANDRGRGDKGLEQRQRPPGGAARGVDRDIGRVDKPLNARAVFTPTGESVFPERRLCRGEFVGRKTGVGRLLRIDPRTEVRRRERRKS